MSQLFMGKGVKPIPVHIEGLDIKPITEKAIVFMFSSESGDYKFTMRMDQNGLRNVAQLLANPPDPCPDHLVLDVDPDDVKFGNNHKIALDETDRGLLEKIFTNAPSLLRYYWLSEEDAQKLLEVFKEFAEKIELDPDRN